MTQMFKKKLVNTSGEKKFVEYVLDFRDEYFVELIFNSEAVGGISSCSTFHLVILATPKLLLTKQGRIYSLHNDDLDMLLTSK